MNEVKQYELAGSFYPEQKEDLEKMIQEFFKSVPHDYNTQSRVLLVPHAPYDYAGEVVADAFQYFNKRVKNVFIFSAAHYLLFYGLAISNYKKFSTPLGDVNVNQQINNELMEEFDAEYNDRVYDKEDGIEVQLPFIQTVVPNAQIIPVVFGSSNFSKIQHIIDKYFFNEDNGFILSADRTHFYSMEEASKIDEINAEQMEMRFSANYLVSHTNLNNGVIATAEFAREKGFSIIRVALAPPGGIADDGTQLQGFGSWMIVEEGKQEFLKEQFTDIIRDICRKSIESGFENSEPLDVNNMKLPPVFVSRGSSYIKIRLDDKLRGQSCSMFPFQGLAQDLAENAFKAAFKDTDFAPLTKEELDKAQIEICLLTRPVALAFAKEDDLLVKIDAGKDGIILRDNDKITMFMPNEWQNFSNKQECLQDLKQRAGLPQGDLRNSVEIYKFRAITI